MWIKAQQAVLLNTAQVQKIYVTNFNADYDAEVEKAYTVEGIFCEDENGADIFVFGSYATQTEAYKVLEEIYAALERGDKVYSMPI